MIAPQFLGSQRGIVGHVGADGLQVGEHVGEGARGADALLRGLVHVVDGDAVDAVELLPCALPHDVELHPYPRLLLIGEVGGGEYLHRLELLFPSPANAPDIADGEERERLQPLLVVVDEAAVAVTGVALGKLTGNLGQRLGRGDANAHGHAQPLVDAPVEPLAPCLEVEMVHAVEYAEALVDGIAVEHRGLAAHDVHQAPRHVGVKLVVAGEGVDSLVGELLLQLEERGAGFDAHGLGLVAARHNAAVVVGQHDDGLAFQVWPEGALATDVAIIITNYQ